MNPTNLHTSPNHIGFRHGREYVMVLEGGVGPALIYSVEIDSPVDCKGYRQGLRFLAYDRKETRQAIVKGYLIA